MPPVFKFAAVSVAGLAVALALVAPLHMAGLSELRVTWAVAAIQNFVMGFAARHFLL